jgi:hypothetical protein
MKTRLEQATPGHVQTFACECEPDEHALAAQLGWPGVEAWYLDFLGRSSEAYALVSEAGRVMAMAGVLRKALLSSEPGRLWLHMPPAFREVGVGGLRLCRGLFEGLLERNGELVIDIEVNKAELVRMADWLGFKHGGFIEKLGRVYHRAYLRRKAAA